MNSRLSPDLYRLPAGALLVLVLTGHAAAQVTSRTSVNSGGTQGNDASQFASVSANGRYVAFESVATNLVAGDTDLCLDIFVRDNQSGITERVSLTSAGAQPDAHSFHPSISADGRYVAFESMAGNLVGGDTNGREDIFVRDRQLGTTERVSVDSLGAQGNNDSYGASISADGRYVAFESYSSNLVGADTNNTNDVFVHDRLSGATERVSVSSLGVQGNNGSLDPSISASGSYVAFQSYASNLVAGDTNGWEDIFVRDRLNGTTERMTVSTGGAQGNGQGRDPSISADGRYVAYRSGSANLVVGDTNGFYDVFVRDRLNSSTERVSVSSLGVQGNNTSGVSGLSISGDGRLVTFNSNASNLVVGDTNGWSDIFVRDRQAGTTERVNLDSLGAQTNAASSDPSISADGRCVAFNSLATNLVAGDTNAVADVFARDRGAPPCPAAATYCTAKINSLGCTPAMGSSGTPSASAGSGFFVTAQQVLASKAGLLFYSTSGPGGGPFQGGILCATPPTKRTPILTSTSAGSPPCTGLYGFDFNARIASGIDPALVVGQQVWCQYWTRDSGVASGTGLTNGLTFVICD